MTSLIVTASPGAEHLSETVAALNFGQRALKVTNSLVVKQEVDYRLSEAGLQEEVDALTKKAGAVRGGARGQDGVGKASKRARARIDDRKRAAE